MAEMIREDYAGIGVEAEIVSDEWGAYIARTAAEDRDGAVLFGWTSDNADPADFLATPLGCDTVGASNRAQWCHQPFEDLIRKAKATTDPEVRSALYREAQEIFAEEAPWLAIAHSLIAVPMQKSVRNLEADPLGRFRFDKASFEE